MAELVSVLLAVVLIGVMVRATPPFPQPLWWGLTLFLLGKAFRAGGLFLRPPGFLLDDPWAFLHGMGLAGLGVFAPWAVYRMGKERTGGPGRKIILGAPPALALLALLPWAGSLRLSYSLGRVFQATREYGFPVVNEFVELFGYSLLGSLFFLGAWFYFLAETPGASRLAEFPFFLGVGLGGFALFRFTLHGVFREDMAWAEAWESLTTFLFLTGIVSILHRLRKPAVVEPSRLATGAGPVQA